MKVYKFPYTCVLRKSKLLGVTTVSISAELHEHVATYIMLKRKSLELRNFLKVLGKSFGKHTDDFARNLVDQSLIDETSSSVEEEANCLVLSEKALSPETLDALDNKILLLSKQYEFSLDKSYPLFSYYLRRETLTSLEWVNESCSIIFPHYQGENYTFLTCEHDTSSNRVLVHNLETSVENLLAVPADIPTIQCLLSTRRSEPLSTALVANENGVFHVCTPLTSWKPQTEATLFLLDGQDFAIVSPNVAVHTAKIRKDLVLSFWLITKHSFCNGASFARAITKRRRPSDQLGDFVPLDDTPCNSSKTFVYTECTSGLHTLDYSTLEQIENVFHQFGFYDLLTTSEGIVSRDNLDNLMLFGVCSEASLGDFAKFLLTFA